MMSKNAIYLQWPVGMTSGDRKRSCRLDNHHANQERSMAFALAVVLMAPSSNISRMKRDTESAVNPPSGAALCILITSGLLPYSYNRVWITHHKKRRGEKILFLSLLPFSYPPNQSVIDFFLHNKSRCFLQISFSQADCYTFSLAGSEQDLGAVNCCQHLSPAPKLNYIT